MLYFVAVVREQNLRKRVNTATIFLVDRCIFLSGCLKRMVKLVEATMIRFLLLSWKKCAFMLMLFVYSCLSNKIICNFKNGEFQSSTGSIESAEKDPSAECSNSQHHIDLCCINGDEFVDNFNLLLIDTEMPNDLTEPYHIKLEYDDCQTWISMQGEMTSIEIKYICASSRYEHHPCQANIIACGNISLCLPGIRHSTTGSTDSTINDGRTTATTTHDGGTTVTIGYTECKTHMCQNSQISDEKGEYTWTCTNQNVRAKASCPFQVNSINTATRFCNEIGEWQEPDTSDCPGTTDYLEKISQLPATAQNAPVIAKMLSNATSAAEYFAAVDVYLAVDVIDNLLNTNDTNTTSIEVAMDILNSVDNLFNVQREVLVTSQRGGNTASRMIESIDRLAMSVELLNESATMETENLVIHIASINTSVYTGISFSVSDNNQKNLDNDNSSPMANMKSSIQLPSSLLDEHSFQDGSSRVQFISYKSNMFFKAVGAALSDDVNQTLNNVTSDYDINNDTIHGVLNGAVIGASIGDLIISDLGEPIKINLTWQRGNLVNPQCVYWNYSLNDDVGGWSTDGCNVSGQSSNNFTTCECDHLTNFALLMDVYRTASEFDEGHKKALSIVSYIGCGISLFCMLLTLITFLAFRRLRKDNPTKILMNLCFAIFMSLLLFLAVSFSVDFVPIIPELCTTMAVLLHYFLLAVMMWMALEAFNMYLLLVKIFKTYIRHFMLKFCLFGWGTPMVIVMITLAIDIDNYGYYNNICWLSRYAFFAAFLAPVCLVLIFNTVIYILVVHQICSLNSKNMSTSDRYDKAAQLRGSVSLFVLLGITWALAILAISEAGLVVNYLFAIANTLQGLFIFIFFCALKKDVQKEWRNMFCSCCHRPSGSAESGSTSAMKYLHRDTDKTDLKSEPSTEKHIYNNKSSSEF